MQENDPNNDIPFYDNNSAQAAICFAGDYILYWLNSSNDHRHAMTDF